MAKVLDIVRKNGYSQLVLDDGTFKNVDQETMVKGKILVNSEVKSDLKKKVQPKEETTEKVAESKKKEKPKKKREVITLSFLMKVKKFVLEIINPK